MANDNAAKLYKILDMLEKAGKDQKEIKKCLESSFNFVWFLTIPMMFGLIAISSKFVPWYYGEGFDGVIPIMIATAPILIPIGLNGITGTQYLVQIGKQKIYTISVTVGAIVNVLLNLVLIHFFKGLGAAIASVIAESIILIIQLKYFKEQFTILKILKFSIKCLSSGIVMFIVVFLLANYMSVSIINTIIQAAAGMITYFIMLIILKYQFLKDILNQVISGVKKKLGKEN